MLELFYILHDYVAFHKMEIISTQQKKKPEVYLP